jgi:hypothetical protein
MAGASTGLDHRYWVPGDPAVLTSIPEIRDLVRRGELAPSTLLYPAAGGPTRLASSLVAEPADSSPTAADRAGPSGAAGGSSFRGRAMAVAALLLTLALAGLGRVALKSLGVLERRAPTVGPSVGQAAIESAVRDRPPVLTGPAFGPVPAGEPPDPRCG